MIKKIIMIPTLVLLGWLFLQLWDTQYDDIEAQTIINEQPSIPTFRIDDSAPLFNNVFRLGINLSPQTFYGAEQYLNNILPNPGFEGTNDRIIVVVSHADEHSFYDEPNKNYPDNAWKGASFEVLSGKYKGFKGKIEGSVDVKYDVDEKLPPLSPLDIISLTKFSPSPIQKWVANDPTGSIHHDSQDVRPGSSGSQSLVMATQQKETVSLKTHLDLLGEKAGKMLPINGNWHFSVWLKSEGNNPNVTFTFQRFNGTSPLLNQTFYPSEKWELYTYDFSATDLGAPELLQFNITVQGDGQSKIWIDDLYLGEINTLSKIWRKEVIETLRILNPSFIRESTTYGDVFPNKVSEGAGRQVWVRHDGEKEEEIYSYNSKDMVELCKLVGSNPWFTIPPTFTREEYVQFGKFLEKEANKSIFPIVIIEFSNEDLDWVISNQGIPYPEQYGEVADRAFQTIVSASNNRVNIVKLIKGQIDNPWITDEFLKQTKMTDGLAVSAYFFNLLNSSDSQDEALKSLFTTDPHHYLKQIAEETKVQNKKIAIYEFNISPTEGTASSVEKNALATGLVSGIAFAKHALYAMKLGYNPLLAYTLAQFQEVGADLDKELRIWGIVRDLGETRRFRPTGLAMAMLNYIVDGSLYDLKPSDENAIAIAPSLTLQAFKSGNNWTAALLNSSNHAQTIQIDFPKDNITIPSYALSLYANNPLDTNEESELVKIIKTNIEVTDRTIKLTIPAYGFIVLPPGNATVPFPQPNVSPQPQIQVTRPPASVQRPTTSSQNTTSIKKPEEKKKDDKKKEEDKKKEDKKEDSKSDPKANTKPNEKPKVSGDSKPQSGKSSDKKSSGDSVPQTSKNSFTPGTSNTSNSSNTQWMPLLPREIPKVPPHLYKKPSLSPKVSKSGLGIKHGSKQGLIYGSGVKSSYGLLGGVNKSVEFGLIVSPETSCECVGIFKSAKSSSAVGHLGIKNKYFIYGHGVLRFPLLPGYSPKNREQNQEQKYP